MSDVRVVRRVEVSYQRVDVTQSKEVGGPDIKTLNDTTETPMVSPSSPTFSNPYSEEVQVEIRFITSVSGESSWS